MPDLDKCFKHKVGVDLKEEKESIILRTLFLKSITETIAVGREQSS